VAEGAQERLRADRLVADPADRVHRVMVQVEQVGIVAVARHGPERARFRFRRMHMLTLTRQPLPHGSPSVPLARDPAHETVVRAPPARRPGLVRPRPIFSRFRGSHP